MEDSLAQVYEEIRFENEKKAYLRKQEIYEKLPEISELDKEIANLSVSYAKKALLQGKNEKTANEYHVALADFIRKKEKYLTDNGYPADYLKPIYRCNLCKDTGRLNGTLCTCYKKLRAKQLFHNFPIKDRLAQECFETFQLNYYSESPNPTYKVSPKENAKNALSYCNQYVSRFDTTKDNILFTGTSGVGKTFLSNCIANKLIEAGFCVIYLTAHQLFDTLSKYSFSHEKENAVETILDCDLLIIDDLGTELTNRFVISELFTCINERAIAKKGTIISTNLSLQSMQELYSERITSRIFEYYKIIFLFGDDIRLKKSL